ncbi:MAG: ABC-2 transporter permease [Tepidibacter sp.]|jgi:ABC-type transport system involved in multi-copper enzyme maturation permease subunit|uniref:ABC transporter permease n=1 Tax=Tepidibacter sp. TaxID=2529387 RepID=UPI0025D53FED|nr:ABC transporter permease [Tepidibacter sp.]MCT4508088.1 ABC-2 transporter permease [Tepidibacter sp.]
MIFSLFKKDLMKFKKETIIFLGLALIINIFCLYKSYNGWAIESGFAVNMFLFPITFLIPLFSSGSKLIGQEWKDNTVYLTMSLPVSSQKIFLSKFLAVIAQYLISSLSIIIITGIQLLIFFNRIPYTEEIKKIFDIRIFGMGSFLYILSMSILIYLVSIIFLSSLTGKMFKKYSKLVSFGLFFIVLFIGGKVIDFIVESFSFHIHGGEYMNVEVVMEFFKELGLNFMGSSLIFLVLAGIIYFVTCKIYDKKIEI